MNAAAPWIADAARGPAPDACGWLDAGGVRLRAAVWRGGEAGHVLLFPGRTEYLEKYAPLIGRLRARGFGVAALDWRGQGLSAREVDNLGHVGDFAEFQEDALALLRWGEVEALPGPRLLLCHSMGGCIGLRALTDGALSGARDRPVAAVFSAPMWGLSIHGWTATVARIAAFFAAKTGNGTLAARRARKTYVLDESFDGNFLTFDREAWDRFVAEADAHPELTLAAPTFSWLNAAFAEMSALKRAAPPATPRLILLGEDERVVSAHAIRAHAAKGRGAELVEIPRARHEPLMEGPDTAAGRAVDAALDGFLARMKMAHGAAPQGL